MLVLDGSLGMLDLGRSRSLLSSLTGIGHGSIEGSATAVLLVSYKNLKISPGASSFSLPRSAAGPKYVHNP